VNAIMLVVRMLNVGLIRYRKHTGNCLLLFQHDSGTGRVLFAAVYDH